MSWQHLQAIAWLRWRLFRNQLRRAGALNTVLATVVGVLAVVASVSGFCVALSVGTRLLPDATPEQVLYLWNGIIACFLAFWLTGLMSELQRSDVLSFQNLLHFPISLAGTFLVNYLSTFFSITIIMLLPPMIGLGIASVAARGPSMLVTFPLIAGFVLTVTALTYQLRGWLAALMVNKRRRRTIIALMTAGFLVLCQLPNLLNVAFIRSRGTPTPMKVDVERWLPILDIALPPGWLAYGEMAAARYNVWPGLFASVGFLVIAGASLWRSYQTTLRFYRGDERPRKTWVAKPVAGVRKTRAANLVERRLPWASEETAAVALATLRSLLRAPEVKMMLLTPLLFGAFFAVTLIARRPIEMSQPLRPLLALGVVVMVIWGFAQLIQNQFGFDRAAFRSYILSPAPRRSILLGKNMAVAPLALGSGALALVAVQFFMRLGPTHFLASVLQLLSGYLILCMVGNQLSILLPTAIRAGSLRSSKLTTLESLLRFLSYLLTMVAFVPLLIPPAIESLWQSAGWRPAVPLNLILSALELGVLSAIYRRLLTRQGRLLQSREQRILEAVTARTD